MKLSDLSKAELGSVQQRFALASDVYKDQATDRPLNGGWQRVFTAADVPGLEDRGFYGAVYKRTINGKDEHIVAFRGVDSFKDIDDAALLAVGKAPRQLTDAYKFVGEAAKKLGFDPASAEYVGHSMGGYLSKAVGLLNSAQKITAFNSPGLFTEDLQGLPRRIEKEFGENKNDITMRQISDNVLSIDSKFDLVSWLGSLRGNTVRIETSGRQHNLTSLASSFTRAVHNIHGPSIEGIEPVEAPAYRTRTEPTFQFST